MLGATVGPRDGTAMAARALQLDAWRSTHWIGGHAVVLAAALAAFIGGRPG
jgi:hypothetical protein